MRRRTLGGWDWRVYHCTLATGHNKCRDYVYFTLIATVLLRFEGEY